jgi:hypothetical protein
MENHRHEMILQISADAGRIYDEGDPMLRELGGGTDSGLHEQKRRVDGAGAKDDAATRPRETFAPLRAIVHG